MNKDIEMFIYNCIKKGESDEMGNYRNGNRYYKKTSEIYTKLKNEERLNELSDLFDHQDPYVRLWSAAYTLSLLPEQAETVLENLIPIPKSFVGFTAEMTLQEWRKGNLKL